MENIKKSITSLCWFFGFFLLVCWFYFSFLVFGLLNFISSYFQVFVCFYRHCFFCCCGCHCSGYRFVGNSDISLQLHNRSCSKLGMLCSEFKVSHSFPSMKRLCIYCNQGQKLAQGRGGTHAQRVTTAPQQQKYMALLSEVYCFRSYNLHQQPLYIICSITGLFSVLSEHQSFSYIKSFSLLHKQFLGAVFTYPLPKSKIILLFSPTSNLASSPVSQDVVILLLKIAHS